MPQILNKYKSGIPKGAVYIGRPSKWGNPFELGKDGDRDLVVEKFEKWLTTGESFGNINASEEKRQSILQSLDELSNKDLVCFCAPKKCHGDVLIKMSKFKPDYRVPPGETILEIIEAKEISVSDLASMLGKDIPWVARLLIGAEALTPEIAEKLSQLGPPKEFWLNYEKQYRE